jgi:hypothetical protein
MFVSVNWSQLFLLNRKKYGWVKPVVRKLKPSYNYSCALGRRKKAITLGSTHGRIRCDFGSSLWPLLSKHRPIAQGPIPSCELNALRIGLSSLDNVSCSSFYRRYIKTLASAVFIQTKLFENRPVSRHQIVNFLSDLMLKSNPEIEIAL